MTTGEVRSGPTWASEPPPIVKPRRIATNRQVGRVTAERPPRALDRMAVRCLLGQDSLVQHALLGLAENTALPPELIDQLIATTDADVAEAVACRSDLSRVQVAALSRFEGAAIRLAYEGRLTADGIDPVARPRVALALLEERSGRPEWARLLAADPSVEAREKLAACPGLPHDVMRTLGSDPDVRVVAELALWAPADIAGELAAHAHADVRRSVAANEATPATVLASLLTGDGLPSARSCGACDGSHKSAVQEIQQMALRNPAAPVDAVVGFVSHPSTLMRVELAARTDLPAQVYSQLAEDPIPWVRATLADNPSISENLIRTLATDRSHDVQRRLAHHPELPLDVLSDVAGNTRIGPVLLPRIASAFEAEVTALAASAIPAVRMLLAHRRDLPPEIRDALADDPDAKVVKSIAPHPGLSEAQLRAMVTRHGARVLAKVAANPDATAQLLQDLALHRPPVRKAFREIARHPSAMAVALLACLNDRQARPLAARHPALPPSAIVELLNDEGWEVVEAAAANPSLPLTVMRELIP
ncbi:hypothetical protein [Nonomuraea glycinis]|uniref:hypothetical protein n=1 Tax=Nonomuraea glycinis TaxID=2047744 RepID=UPI002E11D161|nr:hypothetical protein OHA68_35945 [Nonomuraea glycinis]